MRKNDVVRLIRPFTLNRTVIPRNTRALVLETPRKLSSKVYVAFEGPKTIKIILPKKELMKIGVYK